MDLTGLGYQVITPPSPAEHANIVTFAWSGNPEPVVEHLTSAGLVLRPHQDAAGNHYLRISSHAYNTIEEIRRVGEVLGRVHHE